jgi:polar amino acid transport system substrate-binding protein
MRRPARRSPSPRAFIAAVLVISLITTTRCGLPRDPETTLERVAGGTMRVGISEHDPWVIIGDDGPAGVEVEIVQRFADDLDAQIKWVQGEVEELASALHVREIDLLIAGLTSRVDHLLRGSADPPIPDDPGRRRHATRI